MPHDNLTAKEQAEFDRLTKKKKAFEEAQQLAIKAKSTVDALRYIADRIEVCGTISLRDFNLDVVVRTPDPNPRNFRSEMYPRGAGLYITAFISYYDYPEIETLLQEKAILKV